MKKILLAILAAIIVFAIGVLLIVYFDVQNTFTMILLAASTVGTYKAIANSGNSVSKSKSEKNPDKKD